jgi:hypothetical protein
MERRRIYPSLVVPGNAASHCLVESTLKIRRIIARLMLAHGFADPLAALYDGHEIVALLKDVDWRKAAQTGRAAADPVAFPSGVERPLERQQGL